VAKWSSADVPFFIIAGYDLRGDTTEFAAGKMAEVRDKTVLGDTWRQFQKNGIKGGEITQNGLFDDAVGHSHERFKDPDGSAKIMIFPWAGGAVGTQFTGFEGACQVGYERRVAVGELHGAAAKYIVHGAVEDGIILHPWGAETADGNTEGATSQDAGASSANGGSGYLGITTLTLGTATNLSVKIRHSADDVTYADLLTFTAATAVTAERKTVTGTVNRHLASKWTWTGGAGGGSTATFVVGFCRG